MTLVPQMSQIIQEYIDDIRKLRVLLPGDSNPCLLVHQQAEAVPGPDLKRKFRQFADLSSIRHDGRLVPVVMSFLNTLVVLLFGGSSNRDAHFRKSSTSGDAANQVARLQSRNPHNIGIDLPAGERASTWKARLSAAKEQVLATTQGTITRNITSQQFAGYTKAVYCQMEGVPGSIDPSLVEQQNEIVAQSACTKTSQSAICGHAELMVKQLRTPRRIWPVQAKLLKTHRERPAGP